VDRHVTRLVDHLLIPRLIGRVVRRARTFPNQRANAGPDQSYRTSDHLEDLRLTAWAHMLGFRGHFSTKSRAYSTTLAALRAARAEYQRTEHPVTTGRRPFGGDRW
jgi:hypothetical protein